MAPKFMDNLIKFLNPVRFKDEKSYLSNIQNDYKIKLPHYEEFRVAAHKTMEALLKEGEYRYQILSRTKTPERLKEKLFRKKDQGIYYHSIEEVEDLVGLRVIFYTERDKEKFIKKLKGEIGGYMKIEERKKDGGYKAIHIIMSFGPKRLKLSEYKHFRGFKCEIQIISILHHAWAEIEHDLIYKDVTRLRERNPEKFAHIQEKMNKILDQYIKQAAIELEKVIEEEAK